MLSFSRCLPKWSCPRTGGNRTGDRTFKQDPRGRLHYSHGSSSTSTLSPHPAGTPFSRAGINLSLSLLLFSSFSIFLPPRMLAPPFQNGTLDFQIIEGKDGRKDRLFPPPFSTSPYHLFLFNHACHLTSSHPRLANGRSKIESARSVFSYPRFQHGGGLVGKANRGCHPEGGHRAGCRAVPPAPSLSMQTPRVGPVSSVTDRFCPANATRPTFLEQPSLHLFSRVTVNRSLGNWIRLFVERPLLVIEKIDLPVLFLILFTGIDFKLDRSRIYKFFSCCKRYKKNYYMVE